MTEASRLRNNKQIGQWGEEIAARYYTNAGFRIIGRNYTKKCGELDVIAMKEGVVHFIEVKTVSYETIRDLEYAVSHGTWRPEDNVHAFKLKKLARVIDTWIHESRWQFPWQIDVAAVRIVPRETYATIKIIDNVIFE